MTPDDMTQVWNALKKMKIRPENFLAWAASNSSTGLQPEPQSGTKQKSVSEAGYLKPQPRISIFSGDRKSDVSYDLWKYEVTCLMKESKSEETVLQTIRRSVRLININTVIRFINILINKSHTITPWFAMFLRMQLLNLSYA